MIVEQWNPSWTFSSDVAVPRHRPVRAAGLHEAAGFCNFGIEVVALLLGTVDLILASNGYSVGYTIDGAHGRMGSVPTAHEHGSGKLDYYKIKLLDALLPSFHPWFGVSLDRVGEQMGKPLYYVVHHELLDYSGSMYRHYLDRFGKLRHAYLSVENGPSKDGPRKANELVKRFQDDGLEKTTMTYDVLHAVLVKTDYDATIKAVSRVWSSVLEEMPDTADQIHISWGKWDGLPIAEMIEEKKMLRDLAASGRTARVKRMIGENQHGWFGGINQVEIARLHLVGCALLEAGLITQSHFTGNLEV